MRKLLFLCILVACFSCGKKTTRESYVEKLIASDQRALEVFFLHLLKETSFGYVVFGEKPAFTWGTLSKSDPVPMLGASLHRDSVCIKEGLKILKSLPINHPDSPLAIVDYRSDQEGWNHVWVIHKKHLKAIIEKNLSLFQYVLGPQVSGESLETSLTTPGANIERILRGDRVLIGMILGYGTTNALYGSRTEYLMESMSNHCPLNLDKTCGDLRTGFYRDTGNEPSFGYVSVDEESQKLQNKLQVTVEAFPEKTFPQLPHFGFVSSPESEALIHGYRKTKGKILESLESPDLLNTLLPLFLTGDAFTCDYQNVSHSESNGYVIGQALWQGMFDAPDEEGELAFLEGLKARENGMQDPLKESEYFSLYDSYAEKEKTIRQIEHLHLAYALFENLKKTSANANPTHCDSIFLEKIREGSGKALTSPNSHILASFFVKDIRGKPLVGKVSTRYFLKDLHPALVFALLNATEGEEKVIYLHPNVLSSEDLEKHGGFIIHASLEKIFKQENELAASLDIQDYQSLLSQEQEIKAAHQKAKQDLYFAHGVMAWDHYQKSPTTYCFDEVLEGFYAAKNDQRIDRDDPRFEQLITHMHWQIYQCDTSFK